MRTSWKTENYAFWKEVKKERGDLKGMSGRMQRNNRVLVCSDKKVKEVWERHFE